MIPKVIKIFLVIVVSALIIKGVMSFLYGSFHLKMSYYKFLEPEMKYQYAPGYNNTKIISH